MIVFLTNDLMFTSRVSGVAERSGAKVVVASSTEAALAKCQQESVRLVLIDLTLPSLDIEQLAPQLKATPSAPQLIAYGPHVQAARLAAAQRAGCDHVLTRGQFNAQMEQWLKP